MGRMRMLAVAASALGALGVAGAHAQAPAGPPPVEVQAQGNAIYDRANLRFLPAAVDAQVGQSVRWTNTDQVVPHTATEDHGLWDLAGDYGATPVTPPGFGPGVAVSRSFEAGVHSYYCRVHPQMKGTVTVPVKAETVRRRVTRFRKVRVRARVRGKRRWVTFRVRVWRTLRDVTLQWAPAPAGGNLVYDVQIKRGGGDFSGLATGTRAPATRLVGQNLVTPIQVRARLRDADDASKATEWSPPVTVPA